MSETFKVMVFGAQGVGKSALIFRILNPEKFTDDYEPTISHFYNKDVCIDGENCSMEMYEMIDDAWLFRSGGKGFSRQVDALVLVFSVDSRDSYDALGRLMELVQEIGYPEGAPLIIIAHKWDLTDAGSLEIKEDELAQLRTKFDCTLIEASAKNNYNVEEAFATAVRLGREAKRARIVVRRKGICCIQ